MWYSERNDSNSLLRNPLKPPFCKKTYENKIDKVYKIRSMIDHFISRLAKFFSTVTIELLISVW